jgi:hypothetical protein
VKNLLQRLELGGLSQLERGVDGVFLRPPLEFDADWCDALDMVI